MPFLSSFCFPSARNKSVLHCLKGALNPGFEEHFRFECYSGRTDDIMLSAFVSSVHVLRHGRLILKKYHTNTEKIYLSFDADNRSESAYTA